MRVRPLFAALEAGECLAVTSTLTLVEVLVQPIRKGNVGLAREYRGILQSSSALKVVPLSAEIAAESARLRATCFSPETKVKILYDNATGILRLV